MRSERRTAPWRGALAAGMLAAAAWAGPGAAAGEAAAVVTLVEEGARFAVEGLGTLTLGWPSLRNQGQDDLGKRQKAAVDGASAVLAYDNGAEVHVTLVDGGELRYAVRNPPAGFANLRFEMAVPAALRGLGGQYRVDKGDPAALPAAAPANGHLYQGHGVDFAFRAGPAADAARFALNVPPHGWSEFNDYRAWNDDRYGWWGSFPYNRDHADLVLKLRFGAAADEPAAATTGSGPAPQAAPPAGGVMRLTGGGLRFDIPSLGTLDMGWPRLNAGHDGEAAQFVDAKVAGDTATLNYAGGAVATLRLDGQQAFEIDLKNAPANFSGYRFSMNLPFALNDGGTYKIGDAGAATPFPKEKPARPFLYQGNDRRLTVAGGAGGDFSFLLPANGFMQLQDNREWQWNVFHWWFSTVNNPGAAKARVEVDLSGQAGRVIAKLVDRFGQDFASDFENKVKSEEELAEDAKTDADYFARFKPAGPVDRFGSPPTGAELGLRKTGFFHVQRLDNGRWLLVNPDGNPFFHLGLDSFNMTESYTYIEGREAVYEWLPAREGVWASAWNPDAYWNPRAVSFYATNWIRKYGKPFSMEDFRAVMIPRVRALGFNAIGAFSGASPASRDANFPGVESLPMPGADMPGVRGFPDAFDPDYWKRTDEAFARVGARKDDPLVIGWYIGNEPHAEGVVAGVGRLAADKPGKKALVAFLNQKYQGDVAAFAKAWKVAAADWDAVAGQTLAALTREASDDLDAFAALFFETYYGTVEKLFRKHNPNHLLIGHRWQPSTANNAALVRAAAKHNDVISVNYYTYAFDPAFLARLREWSGDKPYLFSEWHFTAPKDSGLPGGAKVVDTQRERANGYRHYVEQAAALGYVVGIEWFTLTDQARTGRFFERLTGEKANTGLFAVTDRPWKTLVEAAARTNHEIYDVIFGRRAPFVFDDPRFTARGQAKKTLTVPRAANPIPLDGSRDAWPGFPPESVATLAVGPDVGGVSANFRACWDAQALHLMVEVTDPTPMRSNKTEESLWSADGVEIFFGSLDPAAPGGLRFGDRQILIGAQNHDGQPRRLVRNAPPDADTAIRAAVFPRAGGYVLQAALPYAALGIPAPKGGEECLFDLAVDDSEDGEIRLRQFFWNAGAMASSDRSTWGRLLFGE